MKVLFSRRDDRILERRGIPLFYWLDDLGAEPVKQATADDESFLFAGARPIADYRRLTSGRPRLRDRPEERELLLRIDGVLEAVANTGVEVPMPRTRWLRASDPLPRDLTFPLFVRTATSSWKLRGRISRMANLAELVEEDTALRRVFGWDALVCAREWLELAGAGEAAFGPVPQGIRIWLVDVIPMGETAHGHAGRRLIDGCGHPGMGPRTCRAALQILPPPTGTHFDRPLPGRASVPVLGMNELRRPEIHTLLIAAGEQL